MSKAIHSHSTPAPQAPLGPDQFSFVLDVRDSLDSIRHDVEGLALMAIGAGMETSSPEITTPIAHAARRIGDELQRCSRGIAERLTEVRS